MNKKLFFVTLVLCLVQVIIYAQDERLRFTGIEAGMNFISCEEPD